jgi:DEAD/DEAH box helicase domain-containing protein
LSVLTYARTIEILTTGELTKKFKEEFDLRVDWEICSEFGMMSQLGRTLEKMGASASFFREEDLKTMYSII